MGKLPDLGQQGTSIVRALRKIQFPVLLTGVLLNNEKKEFGMGGNRGSVYLLAPGAANTLLLNPHTVHTDHELACNP